MKYVLSVITLISALAVYAQQGYKIELSVKGMKDSAVYLAIHYGNDKFVRDTAFMDKNGKAVFTNTTPLQPGMYLMVIGGNHILDFLISDDKNQDFEIYTTKDDYTKSLKFKNSAENTAFADFSRYMAEAQSKNRELNDRLKKAKTDKEKQEIEVQLKAVNIEDKIASIDKGLQQSLFYSIAKSMKRNDPPAPNIPADTPNREKEMYSYYYQYEKEHYWDNIALDDNRMQNTPILVPAIDNYFTRILIQHPDSIIDPLDKFIEKGSADPKMYKFLTGHLFNLFMQSDIMGMETVVIHIIDKYYLTGKIDAPDKFLGDIKEFANKNRQSLIGMQAHELKMLGTAGQMESLYDVDAPYTLLYFYEPNCGHCKKETPKVYATYQKYKNKGLKSYAVCTVSNTEEWLGYIVDNDLQWLNVRDSPDGTKFRMPYNIFIVPQVYLLDKDKKIIGRRLNSDSLEQMLNKLLK